MLGLSIWWRLFILIIGWGLGFLCLVKTLPIGRIVGPVDWAERRFGQGGTYTAVKLAGLFLIVISVILLFQG